MPACTARTERVAAHGRAAAAEPEAAAAAGGGGVPDAKNHVNSRTNEVVQHLKATSCRSPNFLIPISCCGPDQAEVLSIAAAS